MALKDRFVNVFIHAHSIWRFLVAQFYALTGSIVTVRRYNDNGLSNITHLYYAYCFPSLYARIDTIFEPRAAGCFHVTRHFNGQTNEAIFVGDFEDIKNVNNNDIDVIRKNISLLDSNKEILDHDLNRLDNIYRTNMLFDAAITNLEMICDIIGFENVAYVRYTTLFPFNQVDKHIHDVQINDLFVNDE